MRPPLPRSFELIIEVQSLEDDLDCAGQASRRIAPGELRGSLTKADDLVEALQIFFGAHVPRNLDLPALIEGFDHRSEAFR